MGSVESRIGLVGGRIGSVGIEYGVPIADFSREAAPREAGTGSAGDQKEGVDRQDGSNLSMAVGCLCLHRTWKLLALRAPSGRKIAGGRTRSCNCGRKGSKSLVGGAKEMILLWVILLHPARWQRASIYWG